MSHAFCYLLLNYKFHPIYHPNPNPTVISKIFYSYFYSTLLTLPVICRFKWLDNHFIKHKKILGVIFKLDIMIIIIMMIIIIIKIYTYNYHCKKNDYIIIIIFKQNPNKDNTNKLLVCPQRWVRGADFNLSEIQRGSQ